MQLLCSAHDPGFHRHEQTTVLFIRMEFVRCQLLRTIVGVGNISA